MNFKSRITEFGPVVKEGKTSLTHQCKMSIAKLAMSIEIPKSYPKIFEISWTCHPALVSGSHQIGPTGEMLNRGSEA
jgi:hypothetical protein